jgi:hypothetical protein
VRGLFFKEQTGLGKMIKISIDKLEAGMKLAKPVLSSNGMVLLSEGTELSATWIERIKDMNVEVAFIEGVSIPAAPKDEVIGQLENRFKYVADKPYMKLLKTAVRKHIEGLYG